MLSLAATVRACLAQEISFERAMADVRRAGSARDLDPDELREIVQAVDRLGGRPSPAAELASLFAWAVVDDVADLRVRVGIALNYAKCLMYASLLEEALDVARQAVRWCDGLGDLRALAVALSVQANIHAFAGDRDAQLAVRQRSVQLARRIDDVQMEAVQETAIGTILAERDPGAARAHYAHALELTRATGLHDCEALALVLLAQIDPTPAALIGQAGAAALAARGWTGELQEAVGRIVTLQFRLGLDEQLKELLKLGLELARQSEETQLQGYYAGNLGAHLARQGDFVGAEEHLLAALRIAGECGDAEGVAIARENLARIAPHLHRAPAAQRSGPDTAESMVELLTDVAGRVAGGAITLEELLESLPPCEPSLVNEVTQRVTDLAQGADLTGVHAYALVELAMLWIPLALAQPMTQYRLVSLWAAYCQRAGRIADAETGFARAVDLARADEPAPGQALVAALTNMASFLRQRGRTSEAVALYREAVDRADQPVAWAMAAMNAATAYDDLGRYREARALNEEAMPIFESAGPDYSGALAVCLHNYGGELIQLGDADAAEPHLLRSLELSRRQHTRSLEGPVLGTLGSLRQGQGRYATAIEYYRQALNVAEETRDWWNAGNWCRDLGGVFTLLGLTREATTFFKRGLEYSSLVQDRRGAALCELRLAQLGSLSDPHGTIEILNRHWASHQDSGDLQMILATALALSEAHQALAVGSDRYDDILDRLGEVLPDRPPVVDVVALAAAHRWLDLAEERCVQLLGELAPARDQLALQRARLLVMDSDPRAAIEILTALQRRRPPPGDSARDQTDSAACRLLADIYLHDLDDPATALHHIDEAITDREERLAGFRLPSIRTMLRQHDRDHYHFAVACALRLGDLNRAYAYTERSKNAEGRRSLRFRNGADLHPPSLERMREVAASLGAAIVEFMPGLNGTHIFVIAPGVPDEDTLVEVPGLGLPQLMGLLLTTADAYDALKNPAAAFDPSALQRWRSAVEDACAVVGERLLAPVHSRVGARDAIVFVPHSVLHGLPLHACPAPGGGTWADTHTVSYAPSGAILEQSAPGQAQTRFIGFADPTGDLPCSEAEVSLALPGFATGEVARGPHATRERLLDSLRHSAWIHLACHATQIMGYTGESYLLMAPGGESDRIELADIQQNVVLRPGTSLFLSACETGAVTPELADELSSIAGGFLFAGATTVISTYWRVQDACALLISSLFYTALGTGRRPVASCLADAASTLRNMSESTAFTHLARILDAHGSLSDRKRNRVLAPFRRARPDHYPFHSATDWAAFFVTGHP